MLDLDQRGRGRAPDSQMAGNGAGSHPDPEVTERPTRRRFTAEYKLRIVREAAACKEPGELGALLRREGLYSSHLAAWRKQVAKGSLQGLKTKSRGPKPSPDKVLQQKIAKLEKENARLKRKLEEAEIILEFQKKAADLLGIPLKNSPDDETS